MQEAGLGCLNLFACPLLLLLWRRDLSIAEWMLVALLPIGPAAQARLLVCSAPFPSTDSESSGSGAAQDPISRFHLVSSSPAFVLFDGVFFAAIARDTVH